MQFEIKLHIDKSELKKYYSGVTTVTARSVDGRKVQFPANILQQFITHDGINGLFVLEYNDDFKFKNIQRVG